MILIVDLNLKIYQNKKKGKELIQFTVIECEKQNIIVRIQYC